MSLVALCKAILINNHTQIEALLGQGNFDLNGIHPEFNLRPIDIAAQNTKLSIIQLLVEAGARMARPESLKSSTLNVLLSLSIGGRAVNWKSSKDWFLEAKQLDDLRAEGVVAEHIHAAFEDPKRDNHRIDVEDGEGLTPAYYAALGSKFFLSWLSDELRTNFPNHRFQKGRFAGTTGAWWLTHSYKTTEILSSYPKEYLNTLDLNASFDIGFHPELYLEPKSVLFKLLLTNPGKRLLGNLSDLTFHAIDWNSKEFNYSAALLFAHSDHNYRLLQLPSDRVANLDWVSVYNDVFSGSCLLQPYVVIAGTTLALQIMWSDKSKSLLANLPVEVINKINWTARTLGKSSVRLISYVCEDSTLAKLTPHLAMVLEKLDITNLEAIYNDLERETVHEHYITLPFITFEFLKKLVASFPDENNLHTNYSNTEIQEKLSEIANLFAELEPYQSKCSKMYKKVNGVKGRFIDRMSLSETTANHLLMMANPFFKVNSAIAQIISAEQRVKAIALTYLMRGEKLDRVHGGFITYSIFNTVQLPATTHVHASEQSHNM